MRSLEAFGYVLIIGLMDHSAAFGNLQFDKVAFDHGARTGRLFKR